MLPSQEQRRQQAVARYLAGDKIEDICREMRCSKSWLYKWKNRYRATAPGWATAQTRRPRSHPSHLPHTVAQAVVDLHRTLVQSGNGGSAASIQQGLAQQGIAPVPARRTIYRILQRHTKEGI
jgi:transposase-like protein